MILELIKINTAALFAGVFKRYRNKRKIKPIAAVGIGLLAVYVAGALFITVGAMFHTLCAPFFDGGIGWAYFALAGLFVFSLCFVGTVFMVQAQIFTARDNELLLSMPIKPRAILAGRLFSLLIVEYIFASMVILPVFVVLIVTGYISHLPVLGIVFYFAASLLLPLASLAVGCLFGWLVSLITSRMRNKNVVTFILSVIFVGVYFYFSSSIMGNMNTLIENGEEIAEAVRRSVYPVYEMGIAIEGGGILSFLIFACCVIIPFALVYWLLSASFMKLATGGRTARRIAYREKALRASGAYMALVKRELRFFLTTPLYILNAALGALASIVLAGVLIVSPGLLLEPLEQLGELMPSVDLRLSAAVVLTALAALNNVSAPSISLEGKSLWIAKSLPVPTRDILLAKAYMHILVCGIPTLFAGVVCIFAFDMTGGAQIALTLFLPLSLTFFFAFLGVALNLSFPRFDWINPIQPVKQGLSSMLTIFGGMALVAALAFVYVFFLSAFVPIDGFLCLCALVFIVASVLLRKYVTVNGSRKFDAL